MSRVRFAYNSSWRDMFKTDDEVTADRYKPELKITKEFFRSLTKELQSPEVAELFRIVRQAEDTGSTSASAPKLIDAITTRVEADAEAHLRRFRPEVLREVLRPQVPDSSAPTAIVNFVKDLRQRAAGVRSGRMGIPMYLRHLGVPVSAFQRTARIRMTASAVNPWTTMEPALNDLIRVYWAKDTDPKEWDETREALVSEGVDPERWRPSVRERSASLLSFPRKIAPGIKPVAFDLPADAALDNGTVGPVRIGNVLVQGQDMPVKVAGSIRIVPFGWSSVSMDAEYAVVSAIRLDNVEADAATGRFIPVTGKATYEVTHSTGEIKTTVLRFKGVLTASPVLKSVMGDADASMSLRLAAGGMYGFPSGIQKTAEVAARKLQRQATSIAMAAMKKDAGVVDFLHTHAKREGNRSAKVLLAALKEKLPRVAASAEMGMYGHKARTAQIGVQACADVKLAAGRIAAELHGRKSAEHERITSFLKTHSSKGRCAYSGMIMSCYPDAPVADVPPPMVEMDVPPRLASERVPSSVRGWLTSKD